MLNRISTVAALAVAVLISGASVDASLYRVDSQRSGASVSGFGHSTGEFKNVSGWVAFHPSNIASSEIQFRMPIDDLQVEVDSAVHYAGTKLLGSTSGSAITFKSTSVIQGKDHLVVRGQMTFGSVSREVTIPVEFLGWDASSGSRKAGFRGEFSLDLSDFGIPTGLLGDKVKVRLVLLGVESSSTMIPTGDGPSS